MITEYVLASRPEILHYIVMRLLNFSRIDHSLFNELVCEKYDLRSAEPLFNELIEKGGIRSHDQVITVLNVEVLQQYMLPAGRKRELLQSEEALN